MTVLPAGVPVQLADVVTVTAGNSTTVDINYELGVKNLSIIVGPFNETTVTSAVQVRLLAGMDGTTYPVTLIDNTNDFVAPYYVIQTISDTGPFSFMQLVVHNEDSISHTFSAWIEAD
jgi:hypothetical protein